MKGWKLERLKHCRVKGENGEVKYYVMDGNRPIEVTKDVYFAVEHSYHKEWLQQQVACSKHVSLEQLIEETESEDCHAHMPEDLVDSSAEDAYFIRKEAESLQSLLKRIRELLNQLDDDQRALVLSRIEPNGIIGELARRDHVSPRAIYFRRNTVWKSFAKMLREGQSNE